jgi:hypothetical protein
MVGSGVSVANIVGTGLIGGQVGHGELIASTGVVVSVGEQPTTPNRHIMRIRTFQKVELSK